MTRGRLPSSFTIKDGVQLDRSLIYARGDRGTIYKARYDGRFVAVKVMRIVLQGGAIDSDTAKRVRYLISMFSGSERWKHS